MGNNKKDAPCEDCNTSRRRLLAVGGAIGIAGLAGCSGSDESATADSSGGSGGNGNGNGNGSDNEASSESGDEQEFPEFSAEDPQYPQQWGTLIEHDYQFGLEQDLEQMEPREEAYYGQSPETTPDDESEWIDPDPLEFAYFPSESPAGYADSLEPLIENIEAETGREVNYSPISSYAAQIEAMRSERLHIAAYSSGATAFAVNLAGFVPRSIQTAAGTFGYRLFLITHMDNDEINELSDLEGKLVGHADPSSNSGNLAPRALFAENGVVPGEDYEVEYSGGHENSGIGVFRKDYDAAPVCSTCVQRSIQAGRIEASDLKVIWASNPFPEGSFGYYNKLHPDIQEGFEAAMFDYDYSGTRIPKDFNGRDTFLEIDYNTVWHQNLVIQEANGVDYDVENI